MQNNTYIFCDKREQRIALKICDHSNCERRYDAEDKLCGEYHASIREVIPDAGMENGVRKKQKNPDGQTGSGKGKTGFRANDGGSGNIKVAQKVGLQPSLILF